MSSKRQFCVAWLVCFGIFCVCPLVFCITLGYLCDPSARNPYADRMQQACLAGDTKAVQTMLRQGADVNAPVWEDTTALRWASISGHLDTVKVLLAAGANVNAESSHGGRILSCAESSRAKDEAKIVFLLRRAGARE